MAAGADLGGSSVKSPELKKMRHYNKLNWRQNDGNPRPQF